MKAIMTFAFFALMLSLKAQDTTTPDDYETLTYRLYLEQKWDSLLLKGSEAIDSGFDYLYMLTRTGTAAYYLNKYSLAAGYFEKAQKKDKYDPYTNEMLFYTYLYLGRNSGASVLSGKFDKGDSLFVNYLHPSLYSEGGIAFPDNQSGISRRGRLKERQYNYKEQYLDKQCSYMALGWKQPLSKRISLNSAFSYTDLDKERNISLRNRDSLTGSYDVRQTEFYISPSLFIDQSFVVSPAFRYAMTNISEPIITSDSIMNLFLGGPVAQSYFSYITGAELTCYRNYWRASAGFWYLDMDNHTSLQGSASLMLLPFGSMNAYTNSILMWKNDRDSKPLIFSQMLGFRLYGNSWLEISYTKGNLAGTVENNAQLMNNQINESNYRLGALLVIDVTDHLRILTRYQYLNLNGTIYYSDNEQTLKFDNYKYSKQLITGGFVWNIFQRR
ncbi:MAG TPA: hypothetical protein VK212_01220 [Lentimicrobium sp.]|nr:hypothetical protein [Lentimicrobium sp.]